MEKSELLERLEKSFGDYMSKTKLDDIVFRDMSAKDYDSLVNSISESFIKAFKGTYTEEFLGGNPIYYSTFDDAIEPVVKRMFNEVMNATRMYSDETYLASGLNIKSIVPSVSKVQSKIKYLKEELCNQSLNYEQIINVIEDYIPSTNKYFVDEFMRTNADVQSDLGFKPIVKRFAFYNACDWCKEKEGVYDYESVKDTGNDVWLRHRACNCVVIFENEFRKENAHTKDYVRKVLSKKG